MAGKRYLAIETSSPRLSLALGDENRILHLYQGPEDWRHAESLFEGMKKLLTRARWKVQSLSGVAVSLGPGSFTGIRVGLALARALGQALRIPVVGVSSLEALAAGAPPKMKWLAPQIDALRDQVFGALYRRDTSGKLRRVMAERIRPADGWAKEAMSRSKKERVWLSRLGSDYPQAQHVLLCALPRFKEDGVHPYQDVLPLYIREPAAVERRR